ncbi:helix-turn-helix transcriptional regulator [Pseudomonas sp. S1Bt30]|uniref:Helix-turn-helix transcriptional regulator n=1 Tax=Pseudomonas quebecensis TaxID=2995174 RepID=A0ABY6QGJ3_9PSED|nr:helix-turn-helix transcriptional regulator [Pseudomonas quebecensis]MCX4065137.1 helix-turn-helix transcriptional regulator [Pseudomonas quebecensis]UZW19030.1 helix-turn-helix transcriptional regulator [Pseudomonas quebecensis]UZW23555.1 helix-turn-helix transcriptional regulator [Pseudomonas quebecensis]UZW28617.1 helix-turn-helix transcriptional regulator [Pseudomonas quebecensis]
MDTKKAKKAYDILGALLRQARNSAGLTQDDVAASLNVDRRHYGRIESGQSKISVVRLIEVCQVFGVNPGDIVTRLYEASNYEN